jgi:hypothetical protein
MWSTEQTVCRHFPPMLKHKRNNIFPTKFSLVDTILQKNTFFSSASDDYIIFIGGYRFAKIAIF